MILPLRTASLALELRACGRYGQTILDKERRFGLGQSSLRLQLGVLYLRTNSSLIRCSSFYSAETCTNIDWTSKSPTWTTINLNLATPSAETTVLVQRTHFLLCYCLIRRYQWLTASNQKFFLLKMLLVLSALLFL